MDRTTFSSQTPAVTGIPLYTLGAEIICDQLTLHIRRWYRWIEDLLFTT